MKLRLVNSCVVESDSGLRLVPAGLFKYQVVAPISSLQFSTQPLIDSNLFRNYTFWIEFTETPDKIRGVIASVQKNPRWDNGTPISQEEFGNIAEIIGDGFNLKGYEVLFQAVKDHPSSITDMATILDTPGGQWLDDVSKRQDLSDPDRDNLWIEAIKNYISANADNMQYLSTSERPSPNVITARTKK